MTQPAYEPAARHEAGNLKLYEATDALDIVAEMLAETEGELTPEIEELLARAGADFNAKAERVALKVRELVLEADAVKAEADRLAARARARKNAAESLRAYLCREMQRADRPKIKGELVSLSVQRNQPKLVGADTLDDTYLAGLGDAFVTVTRKLNARAVLELWKREGGTALATLPTTCYVDDSGAHVVIR
jgi:hypothetical protein